MSQQPQRHDGRQSINDTGEMTSLKREQVRSIIIIGSGPAGFTAAIYAARANLKPVLFEGDGFENTLPGGQLMITTEVENYPGMFQRAEDGSFKQGMLGPEMMEIMRAQAAHFGALCFPKRVTQVDFSCRPFRVQVDEEKYFAEAVIVATGAGARWLDIPSEEEYKNFGVTACATCDGALFKGKDVFVVGGGDTAMEEATYLTRHCRTVTVVHRRDQLRASKIMVDRALRNPKIQWIWNSEIVEVLGKTEGFRKSVTAAKLRDTQTGEVRELPIDGIFVAIGHKPNTDLFTNQISMDELGYIRTNSGTTITNVPGVFACGDCKDHVYRQAITAAGTGCMAAIDAERYLEGNPILYGFEEEVSRPYGDLLEMRMKQGEEMPLPKEKQ